MSLSFWYLAQILGTKCLEPFSYFHLQLVIVHHLVADGRKKELLILLQPKACLVVNCNCHLGSPVVSSLFSMQNSWWWVTSCVPLFWHLASVSEQNCYCRPSCREDSLFWVLERANSCSTRISSSFISGAAHLLRKKTTCHLTLELPLLITVHYIVLWPTVYDVSDSSASSPTSKESTQKHSSAYSS